MEILIYGISSFVSQIILIRETITTFQIGEILIPYIISIWLITTSLSSYFSKKIVKIEFSKIKIIYHNISTLLIIIQILTLRSKNLFAPLGEELNILWSLLIIFVSVIEYTLISGIYFQKAAQENENIRIRKIYILDCVGFILGSIMFYIFSETLNIIQMLFILYILNSAVLIKNRKYSYKSLIILIISIIALNQAYNINPISKKLSQYYNTRYGKIEIYKIKEHDYIYYNSQRIFDYSDKELLERASIYSMFFSKKTENIACFSNSIYLCQTISKVFKKKVFYIHYDKKLVDIQEKVHGKFKDLTKINENPIRYFYKNNHKFDLIIINSSLPSTISETSLFSKSFIELLKKSLDTESGIYINIIPFPKTPDKYQKKALSIYITLLKETFKNVEVFYDDFILIFSSQNKIEPNYKLKEFKHYLTYLLENKIKTEEIYQKKFFSIYKMSLLSDLSRTNSKILDLLLKISKYKILISILVLLVLIIYIEKNLSLMMFASFASFFSQYSVIILYQIKYGYIYKEISIILLLAMIGLYLGINLNIKIKKTFFLLTVLIISFSPFLIITKSTLLSSIFITSFISGRIFREISYNKGLITYVFDCLGSVIAILIFYVWILQIENIKEIMLPLIFTSIVFFIKK